MRYRDTGKAAWRAWWPEITGIGLLVLAFATGSVRVDRSAERHPHLDEFGDLPILTLIVMLMLWAGHQRRTALTRVSDSADREREFVRNASHQLRTPITIARGHAELLARGAPWADTTNDAEVVLGQLRRLQRIADRLLILESADHEEFLTLQRTPLRDLVDDAAERWDVVDRRWIVGPAPPDTVLVDRERIAGALDTLIENAVKATPPGGQIALRACMRDGAPVLAVADRGVGVPYEHSQRIFERFARVPPPSQAGWSGTGLGLPMVRAIAEAHGGTARLAPPTNGWTIFELQLGPLRHTAVCKDSNVVAVPQLTRGRE